MSGGIRNEDDLNYLESEAKRQATNKWYVVSEEELLNYGTACQEGSARAIVEAEAACRAREVVEYGIFTCGNKLWEEV